MQSVQIEAIVRVDQLLRRNSEFISETFQQIPGRRNGNIDRAAYVLDVGHPATNPISPVRSIALVFLSVPSKVSTVTTNGALPVVLSVSDRPVVRMVLRVHLDELTPGTHEPVVVQREPHGDAGVPRAEDQRGGKVVEVANLDDVRMK